MIAIVPPLPSMRRSGEGTRREHRTRFGFLLSRHPHLIGPPSFPPVYNADIFSGAKHPLYSNRNVLPETLAASHVRWRKPLLSIKRRTIRFDFPFPCFLKHVIALIQKPEEPMPSVVLSLRHERHQRGRLTTWTVRLDLVAQALECEIAPASDADSAYTIKCQGGVCVSNQTCRIIF